MSTIFAEKLTPEIAVLSLIDHQTEGYDVYAVIDASRTWNNPVMLLCI